MIFQKVRMGIIHKQGFNSTLLNYLGVGFAYANLIFVLPYFLDLTEIGLMRLIIEIASLLMLVFQLGAPYLVIRFFPFYKDSDLDTRSFYTLSLGIAGIGIILMLLFYILFRSPFITYFSAKSELISDYEMVFLSMAIGLILFSLFERIFGSKKIVILPTFIREIINRVGLSVVVVLIGLGIYSFNDGMVVWVGIFFVGPLVLLYLYKKQFGLRLAFSKNVWNKVNYKKYISYSGIVTMGAIGGGLSLKIDMLMTGSMLGLEQLGIYATMVYIATVIEVPKRALTQISDPFISEYYADGRIDKIEELYSKNSMALLVFGLLLFLLIYSGLPYLFEIMPKGDQFATGINVFLIIAGVKILSLLGGIANQILLNSTEAWVSSMTIIILAIMSIGLNYLLIPIYGLEGAAFATLISVGVNSILIMMHVFIKFKIHPFCREMIYLSAITSVLFAVVLFFPKIANPYLGLLLSSALISLLYGILVYYLKLSEDVNVLIENIIVRGKIFFKNSRYQ
ncbi:MAG: oligosaccharide flippase family protein [Flavobacteriales bacterium]|nr:oligosaccharide flippase family protein [Flavobacteriales bacterium]